MRNIKESIPYLAAAVIGIILFIACHRLATAERGYVAFGGEIFMLFMPWVAVGLFRPTVKEVARLVAQGKTGTARGGK